MAAGAAVQHVQVCFLVHNGLAVDEHTAIVSRIDLDSRGLEERRRK